MVRYTVRLKIAINHTGIGIVGVLGAFCYTPHCNAVKLAGFAETFYTFEADVNVKIG